METNGAAVGESLLGSTPSRRHPSRSMVWDACLLSIFAYNIVRSARRGGSALSFELASFFTAYAATFTFAPPLNALVRDVVADPPLLLPIFSVLVIYFVVSRTTRAVLLFLFPERPRSHDELFLWVRRSRVSQCLGGLLGVVRGAIIVAGIAMIGCSFARLQDLDFATALPPARDSLAIKHADGLIRLVTYRYTRTAGPTTRQLIELSHRPSQEKIDEILEGSFAARMKTDIVVVRFTSNAEVRRFVRERQTAKVLVHPTFLRAFSHVVRELQNEPAG